MSVMRLEPVLILLVLAAMIGCKKDDGPTPTNGGTPWTSHVAVSVDSAFIMAPNLVTPNADGINDFFHVVARHVTSLQTSIMDSSGTVVFDSQSLQPVWGGLDQDDLGRYSVFVSAVSISGNTLEAQSYLYVLDYTTEMCLPFTGTPATGDQFDPRIFGLTYASNDIFCE